MSTFTDDTKDRRQIVALLAEEGSAPIDQVAGMYDRERAQLQASSRIKPFVTVLAMRHVRDALRAHAPRRRLPPIMP